MVENNPPRCTFGPLICICCFAQDLVEHPDLVLCPIFTERPRNDWKHERSNEPCFVCNKFSWIPLKIAFHIREKSAVTAQNLQGIKAFLPLEASQYSKSESIFPTSKPVEATSNCSQLGDTPCLSLSIWCARALPKELCHWFCSQNLRLSSGIAFRSDCRMICRGSNLDSNLNSAHCDQPVVKVLSALKSLNKLCWVWNLFGQVEDAEIEASIFYLIPQTSCIKWVEHLLGGM